MRRNFAVALLTIAASIGVSSGAIGSYQTATTPGAATTPKVFTVYPGKRATNRRIEAIIDRGPILELIVKCAPGTAILSYSKVDRKYCSPKLVCGRSLKTIIKRSCG